MEKKKKELDVRGGRAKKKKKKEVIFFMATRTNTI